MAEQITEAGLQETIVARLSATHVEVADISGTPPPAAHCPLPTTPPMDLDRALVLASSAHVPLSPSLHPANPISLSRATCVLTPARAPSYPLCSLQTSPRPNIPLGGCGQAFQATIVSPQFAGLSSLKRHRLVNAALKDEIATIHAWTAKCLTPEQWESR